MEVTCRSEMFGLPLINAENIGQTLQEGAGKTINMDFR
jgi:hypothetical protein